MCLSRCRPAGFYVPWGETRQTFHPIHGRQRASHRSKSLPVAIPQQFLSEIESHFPKGRRTPCGVLRPLGGNAQEFHLSPGGWCAQRHAKTAGHAGSKRSGWRQCVALPPQGRRPPAREWPGRRVGELNDMRGVLGMGAPEELAAVPGVDQQLDRIAPRAASG